MDTLCIDQAHLVGSDIALLPTLLVGLEHPERVLRLAVMDGIPFPAQISYLKGFYRGHSIPADVLREFAADGADKRTQEAFLSYFRNFRAGQEYFEPRAHELLTPVLVVWGKYDRFISSKLGEEIANRLPNASLNIIDKAGHYVHMDKPKILAEVVGDFLAEGDHSQIASTKPSKIYQEVLAQ